MTLLTASPPPVVDLKLTRDLFVIIARVGSAMFKQDPGTGQWQPSPAADAICVAIDPTDPNLKAQALAAYLEYISWTQSQTQASWVP